MVSKFVYAAFTILVAIIIIVGLLGYFYGLNTSSTSNQTQTVSSTASITVITTVPASFEKLEISSAYANPYVDGIQTVVLNLRNTGPQDATVTDILLNGKPLPLEYVQVTGTVTSSTTYMGTLTVKVGESATITITFHTQLSSGTMYNFIIHTAAGNDYPRSVNAP